MGPSSAACVILSSSALAGAQRCTDCGQPAGYPGAGLGAGQFGKRPQIKGLQRTGLGAPGCTGCGQFHAPAWTRPLPRPDESFQPVWEEEQHLRGAEWGTAALTYRIGGILRNESLIQVFVKHHEVCEVRPDRRNRKQAEGLVKQ